VLALSDLSQSQILLWLGQFLWPFLRMTGLCLTAPLYGSPLIPGVVKAVLAAVYAAALAAWLPGLPAFPGDAASAVYAGVVQIAYGAMLGMVMQLVVAAVAGAGEMAGLAMGLSFAELQFRESAGASPVLYDIMVWAGLLGFMAAGGPVWLFVAMAHSFQHGVSVGGVGSWAALAELGGNLFGAAVGLAMPVLAVSLCVNLTVGLCAVFSPQMNLLSIGFPLLILAGLWVMAGALPYAGGVIGPLMGVCTRALAAMAGG
jgi:flagellar biosynthetic protein FliR